MLQVTPIGLLALAALIACWGLAVVLFRVGTPGSVPRYLAWLLLVEGIAMFWTGYIDLFLTDAVHQSPSFPAWVRFEEIVHTFGDCAMLALYPPFLAAALRTPLTSPFGSLRMRLILALIAALLGLSVFLTPLRLGATMLYILLVSTFVAAA